MQLRGNKRSVLHPINVFRDLEGTVLAHVRQGGESLAGRGFRESGHAIFEDPPVILFNRDSLSGTIGGFKILANPHAAVRVDVPGQAGPELVLFPDFAGIRLIGKFKFLAGPLARNANDRLPEGNPARRVGFLALQVVPFSPHAHGKDVIGEPGRLAPGGSQSGVEPDLFFIPKHLNP